MGSLGTLLPVLLGAVIGFVPNYLLERRRERAQMLTRWDSALFQLCSDFTESARSVDELAQRLSRGHGRAKSAATAGTGEASVAERLAAEHLRLRSLGEQIRLLGSHDVQVASRWVVRHAYAVRQIAEGRGDPREAEFPDRSARDRLRDGLDALYLAVRVQLRVPGARVVAPREPHRDTAPLAPRAD
jgi:hypothetical protein